MKSIERQVLRRCSRHLLAVLFVLLLPRGQLDAVMPVELTRDEKEHFLLIARVIKTKSLSVGITSSQKATLTNGDFTHDAHVQTVDIRKPSYTTLQGTEINFRDSYRYNIAAYRLDKLLNLRIVPVSVERKVGGETAALTWWVDDVLMMERERFLKKIEPPDRASWNDQMYQVRVFNNLIYNTDPNLGNVLITSDWKLWAIDFARAFRLQTKLRDSKELTRIDRRFYNGLRALNEDILLRELRPLLTRTETKALLARRDLIIEFLNRRVARLGEAAVICDRLGH